MMQRLCILLAAICVSSCCSVPQPPSPPDWVTVTVPTPTGSACSAYSRICSVELSELDIKLRSQMACCGSDGVCRSELTAVGSALWNQALGVHAMVHTNLPTSDKELALSELHQKIVGVAVCKSLR